MEAYAIKNLTTKRYLSICRWQEAISTGTYGQDDNPLLAKLFVDEQTAQKTLKALNTKLNTAINQEGGWKQIRESRIDVCTKRPELAICRISDCTITQL